MDKLSTDLSIEVAELSRAFNLVIEYERFQPEHFGDAILILAAPKVAFRIIRERTELFMDVRGASGDWVDVRGILGTLGLLLSPTEVHPVRELIQLVINHPEVFAHS